MLRRLIPATLAVLLSLSVPGTVVAQQTAPAPTPAPAATPAPTPAATAAAAPQHTDRAAAAELAKERRSGSTSRPQGTAAMGSWITLPATLPAGAACGDQAKILNGQANLLYANGRAIPGAEVWFACQEDKLYARAFASIEGADKTGKDRRQAWRDALGGLAMLASYPAELEVGLEDGRMLTPPFQVTLSIIATWKGTLSFIAFLIIAAAFAWGIHKGIGKNLCPDEIPDVPMPANYKRTYSLSRLQLLWWTAIILWIFLTLLLAIDATDTLSPGAMLLMGIVGGTSLLSAFDANRADQDDARRLQWAEQYKAMDAADQVIAANTPVLADPAATDAAKTAAQIAIDAAHKTLASADRKVLIDEIYPQSRGVLDDILTDASGYSAHRFQLLAWTVALGIAFVYEAFESLAMMDLSPNLLALLGISNGAYFGFKLTENQVSALNSAITAPGTPAAKSGATAGGASGPSPIPAPNPPLLRQ